MGLQDSERSQLIISAKERAGSCFLCGWIVEKKNFEDFPRAARMEHLILCCQNPSEKSLAR